MEPIKLEFIVKGDIDKELSRIQLAVKGVGDQSYTSFKRLAADSNEAFIAMNKQNQQLAISIQEDINSLRQLGAIQKSIDDAFEKGNITTSQYTEALAKLSVQEIDLRNSIISGTKILHERVQSEKVAEDSITQLNNKVRDLTESYYNLSKADRDGAKGQGVLNQIQELDKQIVQAQSKLSQYSKTAGTRFNGLNMSIQQVARELPSLTMGANMFFLAISNNLPILADNLRSARMEYDLLKKSGQSAVPVWKQVLSSIVSWQTALVVGITLLSVYGKDILNWVQGLFGADQAQKKLNESLTDFNSILSKEQKGLSSLYSVLERTKEGTEGRRKAIQNINTAYGKYLPYLLSEKSSLQELNAAYIKINKSLRENAALKAQSNAVDKVLEKSIKVQSEALTEMRNIASNRLGSDKAGSIMDIIPGLTEDFRTAGQTWQQAWQGVSAKIQSELGNKQLGRQFYSELESYVKSVYKSEKQISDIQKQFNPFFNKDEAEKAIVQNKEFWEGVKQQATSVLESISSEQRKLLDNGNTKGIDAQTIAKYKRAKDDIGKATSELKVYDSFEKQQKETDKIGDLMTKMNHSILENELKLQAGRISAMEDGRAKRIALAKQETKDAIAAIQKEKQEYQKKIKETKGKEDTTVITTFDNRELAAKAKEKTDIALIEKEYAEEYTKRTKALTDIFLNEEQRKLSAIKTRYAEERKWADQQLKTGGMTKDEHKSYTSNIDKAEQQETYRSLLDSMNDYKQQEKDLREKWDTDINAAVEAKDAYLVAKLQEGKQKALSALNGQMLQESTEWQQLFGNLDNLTVEQLEKLSSTIKKKAKDLKLNPVDAQAVTNSLKEVDAQIRAKNPFESLSKHLKEYKKAETDAAKKGSLKEMFRDTAASIDTVKGGFDAVVGGLTDMGLAGDEATQELLGDISNLMGAASQLATSIASANPVGIIQGSIGVLTSVFNIFNSDRKHEKKIKELQEQVDILDKSYEKLGDSIEKAYSKDASNLIEQQNKLLEQQKLLIQQQIMEEEDKKHTDNDRIKEWRDQIDEINKTIADNKDKAIDAIFGEEVESAIDNLAQAYVDAWSSGDDKVKASKDLVKNMIKQMIIEAMKADIAGPMEAIRKKMADFWSDEYISDSEQDILDRMAEDLTGMLDRTYSWADKYLKGEKELQDGVSGQLKASMTEGTASQLVGLWNSTSIDMRELKHIGQEQNGSVKSILSSVSEIIKQNVLIEQNTRRGADNTDGLIEELQGGFKTLDKRLENIEKNTKTSNSRG